MQHRYCKDCRYFMIPKGIKDSDAQHFALCLHEDSVVLPPPDHVTGFEGKSRHSRCHDMRAEFGLFQFKGEMDIGRSPCGPEAKLFEAKDKGGDGSDGV